MSNYMITVIRRQATIDETVAQWVVSDDLIESGRFIWESSFSQAPTADTMKLDQYRIQIGKLPS